MMSLQLCCSTECAYLSMWLAILEGTALGITHTITIYLNLTHAEGESRVGKE